MSEIKMKMIGVKVPPPIHERFSSQAKAKGISLSEYVRNVLTQICEARPEDNPSEGGLTSDNRTVTLLETQLPLKDRQLDEKDKQIAELHQLLAIQSKTTAQLTNQLDAMKQLEDMRSRRSWSCLASSL